MCRDGFDTVLNILTLSHLKKKKEISLNAQLNEGNGDFVQV